VQPALFTLASWRWPSQHFEFPKFLDQGTVNCLDPVGHACVEEREGPLLGPVPYDTCFYVSRDSEGMVATWGRAASIHYEQSVAGSGHQQSVRVVV
jgi:hypothetical protein